MIAVAEVATFASQRGTDKTSDFDNRRRGRGGIDERAVIITRWMFVLALGSMYLGAIDVFREGNRAVIVGSPIGVDSFLRIQRIFTFP